MSNFKVKNINPGNGVQLPVDLPIMFSNKEFTGHRDMDLFHMASEALSFFIADADMEVGIKFPVLGGYIPKKGEDFSRKGEVVLLKGHIL